jgi:hypothetical protein
MRFLFAVVLAALSTAACAGSTVTAPNGGAGGTAQNGGGGSAGTGGTAQNGGGGSSGSSAGGATNIDASAADADAPLMDAVAIDAARLDGTAVDAGSDAACHATALSPAEIAPLFSEYAYRAQPGLAAGVSFDVRALDVPGLWDDLHAQLLYVIYKAAGGSEFARRTVLFRDCVFFAPPRLSDSTAMPLSGVMAGGALWLSYESGSGILRTNFIRLTFADSQLESAESAGGYQFKPLFLRREGAVVLVETAGYPFDAVYPTFNPSAEAQPFGTATLRDGKIVVVDAGGTPIPWTI